MKTTLILNREYRIIIKSYNQRQTFWEIFSKFNFIIIVLLVAQINPKIESDIAGIQRAS